MKIRYKISILMTLLTVVIVLLINLTYVKSVTWGTVRYVTRFIPHEITSDLLDVPTEDDIDWDDKRKLRSAITGYQNAIEQNKELSEAAFNLGLLYYHLGD